MTYFLLHTSTLCFFLLYPFISVRDVPGTETKGRGPSSHAFPVPFVSAGRGARGERPHGLSPQPHSRTDRGEVGRHKRLVSLYFALDSPSLN